MTRTSWRCFSGRCSSAAMPTHWTGKGDSMKTLPRLFGAAVLLVGLLGAQNKPEILTTTMDLADIVKRIGGDHVTVESFARGDQDLHRIPAQPKYLLKLNHADALFEMGLDLEHAWLPALLEATRNDKV